MLALSNRVNKRRFDRDFQRLATLSAASLAGFGFLLLAIIAFAGWSSNRSATERESILLQNALNRGIARALNEQKSVAWWDDAVLKITDESVELEFVDSNFGVFLTETYGHDEVYILNAADRPIYVFAEGARGEPAQFEPRRPILEAVIAETRGGQPSKLKARPDAFGADQKNYRTLAGAVQTARWAGHILSVDGKLAIVAALTIVPNVDMSLLKGTPNLLISVTYIDDDYVTAMGRSLLMADLAISQGAARTSSVVSEPFDGDDGVRGGYLSWTTQRPGQVLLTMILPLVALGVIAVAVLANGMIRRLKLTSNNLADRESQSRHAARHDSLSGLPNRAHFADRLSDALNKLTGGQGAKNILVAYIDIDRFKDVNDTLGHYTGDELIKAVTRRLQSISLSGDFLARYGGDEFAIMCYAPDPRAGDGLAQRIDSAFASPFQIGGQSLYVTASIGIAVAPDHGTTVDELVRHADIALYEAKTRGRHQAVFFTQDMANILEERRRIEVDLRAAIDAGQLRLNYQPIMSCRTGAITGVEALLRWRHPARGEISPATFISIAEQSGLMPALGEWVLSRAMSDSRQWPQLQVSINLSPVQLRQADFELQLRQLVGVHGIRPGQFVLEITEGVLMESCDHTRHTLDAIQDMGFQVALDDFGTGYSSLAYLCKFRFDKIKIDRSFVSGMSKSDNYRKIVQSVIALGKGLGMGIVAEGVESENDALTMIDFGCNELQGYHFSRPLDLEPLLHFIANYEPKFVAERPVSMLERAPLAVAS